MIGGVGGTSRARTRFTDYFPIDIKQDNDFQTAHKKILQCIPFAVAKFKESKRMHTV